MSEYRQFQLQQIVWATVDQYPPWPAKIIRKLHQQNKQVFKVHFFGDPSYCYLHEHSLKPFNIQTFQTLNSLKSNLNLSRAIELARLSLLKQIQKMNNNHLQAKQVIVQNHTSQTYYEQSDNSFKSNVEFSQKKQMNDQKTDLENPINSLIDNLLTPDNVLLVLQQYRSTKSPELQNLKRKQIISFQTSLKQNLLLRYKLDNLNYLKLGQSNDKSTFDCKPKKIIKKEKKTQIYMKNEQLCYRKVHKLLVHKGLESDVAKRLSKRIICEIEDSSIRKNVLCQKTFKQNFIIFMRQISNLVEINESRNKEYLQKQVLNLLENQGKEQGKTGFWEEV